MNIKQRGSQTSKVTFDTDLGFGIDGDSLSFLVRLEGRIRESSEESSLLFNDLNGEMEDAGVVGV